MRDGEREIERERKRDGERHGDRVRERRWPLAPDGQQILVGFVG